MKFNQIKSPNFSKKSRQIRQIKYIILHYTGMQSKRVSIARLCSPTYKVSCHYLIDRDGEVTQMVDDKKIAWHAGKSKWKNIKNLNGKSIGIELVNKGHDLKYEKFRKIQITKLIKLCLYLKKKYKINKSCILGHSDIAPLRKKDPGEKFPWLFLSRKGLGLWHQKKIVKFKNLSKKKKRDLLFSNLFKIGYRYFNKKNSSKKDKLVIKAFQRKFLPMQVDGKIDKKTLIISHFLANTS